MLEKKGSVRGLMRDALLAGVGLLVLSGTVSVSAQEKLGIEDKNFRGEVVLHERKNDVSEHSYVWSDGENGLEVRLRGTSVEFNEDDSDIKNLEGILLIKERRGGLTRAVEIIQGASGAMQCTYFVNGEVRPYDNDARAWFATVMPQVIRSTSFGARERASRLLKERGVDGVLAEISLLRSDSARKIYYQVLIKESNVDAALLQRILQDAATQMRSDSAKEHLLVECADLVQNVNVPDFLIVVDKMQSDSSRERALIKMLGSGRLNQDVMQLVLKSAKRISSDSSKERVLVRAMNTNISELAIPNVLEATGSIHSDSAKERVLITLLQQSLNRDLMVRTIKAALLIHSDSSKERVLIRAINHLDSDQSVASAVLDVANTISSDSAKGRVFTAMMRRGLLKP